MSDPMPVMALGDDPCGRVGCGHIRDAHRLDDALNISPTDPAAPFRCVGYPEGQRWIDTDCSCPDWTEPT